MTAPTIDQQNVLEVWETATAHHSRLRRTDSRGYESSFRIGGAKGRRFTISKQDREMNQNLCFKTSYDPFTNGKFVPVSNVPENYSEIHANAITDDAIYESFALGSPEEFAAWLATLSGEHVLRRVETLANSLEDFPASKAKLIAEAIKPYQPVMRVPSQSGMEDAQMPEIRLNG